MNCVRIAFLLGPLEMQIQLLGSKESWLARQMAKWKFIYPHCNANKDVERVDLLSLGHYQVWQKLAFKLKNKKIGR